LKPPTHNYFPGTLQHGGLTRPLNTIATRRATLVFQTLLAIFRANSTLAQPCSGLFL